jgi:hypothetical protein
MVFRNLTFTAESCFVLVEPFESDFLADEFEELVEGRTALLVVVHVLLSLLTLAAIHQPDLKIETEKVYESNVIEILITTSRRVTKLLF